LKTAYGIEQVILDARVVQTPLARRIVERRHGSSPSIVGDVAALVEQARGRPDALTRGKRTLLVTERKGPFLSACQGMAAHHHACCDYRILNVFENCPLDCSYCILQSYLNNPLLVLYANLEGLSDEIARVARHVASRSHGKRLLRLGTGELGDSLAFDRLTDLSLDLMRVVAPFSNVILELKTKTVEIENLLSVAAPRNVVVSWSLNTPRHTKSEEVGAASLAERLAAAKRCQQDGYRLGFHFDPLIHSPHWEEEYREVVEALFDHVDPSGIVWISLGALRYPPTMRQTIEARFPRSQITSGELVLSWDGKLRYFRPIRVAMYRKTVEWIRARAPNVVVYLCMESREIWREVFGWSPRGVADVAERLDAGCRKAEFVGRAVRTAD